MNDYAWGMSLEHDLKARQSMVFKKIHFLVALYVDPRFNNKEMNERNDFLSVDGKSRCVVCIAITN